MRSPNGKFEVFKINYTEVRMGSPLFGSLDIIGSPVKLGERWFGEPMCFSPDSKYLAIQELYSSKDGGPNTKLILIELETGKEIFVKRLKGGFLNPVKWETDGLTFIQKKYQNFKWHSKELMFNLEKKVIEKN